MAPYEVTSWGSWAEPAVHVGLGMGFGFVLERAGFGSSKKLTNQFYLNDMTVLKVMFTAIITAMVLVLVATTFGWLDYERLWINPTYLGSGIVGGLLFGVGFVVGGFCPGTAIVSAATLKVDGLLFALGVLGGILVFGYTEPLIDGFWNDSGNYGRVTLFDWMGLPMPLVVALVVVMALVFFGAGEWVERSLRRKGPAPATDAPMRFRVGYAYGLVLVGTAAVMALLWEPMRARRSNAIQARIERSIQSRQVQVEPRELAELMQDKRISLRLLDVRDEPSFNRFHLLDAQRYRLAHDDISQLAARSVKVLVADDESLALAAYRSLAAKNVENLYVLAGGMRGWSELFDARGCAQPLAALGARHPQSRPPLLHAGNGESYVHRVKLPGLGAKKSGGGCGG